MSALRLAAQLIAQARTAAIDYAVRRLVERRPGVAMPAGLPVIVPASEDARYSLDMLTFLAWVARQMHGAVEVQVATTLHARATWAEIAEATRLDEPEARARYGHLDHDRAPEGGGRR